MVDHAIHLTYSMRPDQPQRHDPEVTRHSGWLLPLAALGAVATVCALFLLYYLAPAPTALVEEHVLPSARAYPVHLRIGGIALVVPANYLPYASERVGGPREQVVLYAELPDFHGYSGKEPAGLEENGARSPIIHILIRKEEFNVSEAVRLERIYLNEVVDRRGLKGPFGLTQYVFRSDSGYHGEDIFVGRTQTNRMVMRCTRSGPELPPASCLREMQLAPDVSQSYRFARSHLSDWRKIADGVSRLVASFRRAAS